ncbi:MAG: HD domain-containing phosphohydrolase [Candidatus Rifleibacteriota bacterium]
MTVSKQKVFAVGLPDNDFSACLTACQEFDLVACDPLKDGESHDFADDSVFLINEDSFVANVIGFQRFLAGISKKIPLIVFGNRYSQRYMQALFVHRPFTYLQNCDSSESIVAAIKNAAAGKSVWLPLHDYATQLEVAKQNIEALHKIGIALSAESDIDKLLDMILTQSRNIAEADAGSLYLVENESRLRFKLSQNVSLDWAVKQDTPIEISCTSISGYTASSKSPLNLLDSYKISENFPFTFNRSYDEQTGYRSKSMLAVPMKNLEGQVLGVIQLINKRTDYAQRVPGEPLDMEKVIPFRFDDLELLSSLASQAAVAIENLRLYQDIKNVFEGFVKASIFAIESRDPTTRGHSERVAELTLAIAREINSINDGPFANFYFDEKKLTELRYATLLHDFGKVGVREEILVKAKKLFPHELELLQQRYRYIQKSLEADFYKECLDYAVKYGIEKFNLVKPALEGKFSSKILEVQDILEFLVRSNEPSVMEDGNFHRLLEIANLQHIDHDGMQTPFLTERETHVLSIRRGSLSETERIEIESHVRHTFNFLSKIPWTKSLCRIPEIAYAHHEKLNGRGYPNHLEIAEIPFESQMLSVADIFDALTAQDRPYKPAVPLAKAIDILYFDVNNQHINREIVDLFVQRKLYRVIEHNKFR